MRINCRISLSPTELNRILATLVDRLGEAGVTRIPGFNLYINPLAGGSEMELRNEEDESVEIFVVDDPSSDQLLPARSMYRLMLRTDYPLRRTFLWFATLAKIPDELKRSILGGIDASRWQQLMAPMMPELTSTERKGMQAVVTVAHHLAQLCGDEHEVIKWLHGPFPANGLAGETPAEQLTIGGVVAFQYFGKTLGAYIRDFWRDGLHVDPPPRGFDKDAEILTASVPLVVNEKQK